MNNQAKNKKKELTKKRNIRITFMGVAFCVALGVLFFRMGYLQYTNGDEYERYAVRQLVANRGSVEQDTNPNRGQILDINKQPLATSVTVYTVALDVAVLDSLTPVTQSDGTVIDYKEETLNGLSTHLNIPLADLEAYFAHKPDGTLINPTNWKILANKVPAQTAMQIKDLKHVYLQNDTERKYVDPTLAPQTIGFLRGPSAWGLESEYNEDLMGEQGRIYRSYDQDNNAVTNEIPPRDGYTLITTLDSEINRMAQDIVNKHAAEIECEYAGIAIMKPYTGEIVALAQWPSFSLNDPANPAYFTDNKVKNYWEALGTEEQLNEMYRVWGNFHTTEQFEPGSIFKPVVVAAALEQNLIDTVRLIIHIFAAEK